MSESSAGLDLIFAIGSFFHYSWKFFTDINVPGFNFSFAALFFGLFLMGLGLRFLGAMFGFSVSSGDISAIKSHIKSKPGSVRNDSNYHSSSSVP